MAKKIYEVEKTYPVPEDPDIWMTAEEARSQAPGPDTLTAKETMKKVPQKRTFN